MEKIRLSFEEEVIRLPRLMVDCPECLYADFTKIESFCDQLIKDRSIKIKRKEEALTKICDTMVELLESFEDYRTQRKSFEIFQLIVMKFVSLQHFQLLIPSIKRMLRDNQFPIYRRRCVSILTNTVKKIDDQSLLDSFVREMLCIAKKEKVKILLMDLMDFLSKMCPYIDSNNLIMDIFWFLSFYLEEDEEYRIAARKALSIMWEGVSEKALVYEGIKVLAKENMDKENVCLLVELVLKGLNSDNLKVSLNSFKCLKAFRGIRVD